MIDEQVRAIVENAFHRTVALLKEQRPTLERAAKLLLEQETIPEDELREIVAGGDATRRTTVARPA